MTDDHTVSVKGLDKYSEKGIRSKEMVLFFQGERFPPEFSRKNISPE